MSSRPTLPPFTRPPSTLAAAAAALALSACADRPVPTAPSDAAPLRSAAAAAAAAPAAAVDAGSAEVVMRGLDNPRGIAFDPAGALYVAESGTAVVNGPCVAIGRGSNCYSGTGAISRLRRGRQARVLAGLPSVVNPGDNNTTTGPNHIAFRGRGGGVVTFGWGAPPALRAGLGALGAPFATLARFNPGGGWSVIADLGAFEAEANPDGEGPDTNPYGVLAEGGRAYVTDAGGNTLLEVRRGGRVALVAVIPRATAPSAQAVPTEVRRGPDGAFYVSTLSGVPFAPGNADLWRVAPGAAPARVVRGLTQVTDFAVAPDGALYVLQYASGPFFAGAGSVVRIPAGGGAPQPVVTGLQQPTGLALGADRALYVAHRSVAGAGQGEVLRVPDCGTLQRRAPCF